MLNNIKTMKKERGFTIVELLIVIVVIAILAAITIVAYNGIQARAQIDKTSSAVHAYLNALELFKADHDGNYPDAASLPGIGTYNCLGEDYASDMCWNSNGTYKENATFNAALKTLLGGTLPMAGDYGTITNSGVLYVVTDTVAPGTFWTVDGQPTNWLVYGLPDSTRCPVGPVATYTGTGFTSAQPASGQTTAGTCWIPIKN